MCRTLECKCLRHLYSINTHCLYLVGHPLVRGNTEDILDLRADIDLKGKSLTSIFGVLDGGGGGGSSCRMSNL